MRDNFARNGGVTVQETDPNREYLKVKIDLPSFQFEVMTRDPQTALGELRRILEVMHLDEDVAYEEFVQQDLRANCSEAFLRNAPAMAAIKTLLKQEDGYRVVTATIARTTTVDLDTQMRSGRISPKEVQRAIGRLTDKIICANVKHGIIHINGELDKEAKLMIADNIHRLMPTAQLRAFHTKEPNPRVGIECIFFGDFPEEDD